MKNINNFKAYEEKIESLNTELSLRTMEPNTLLDWTQQKADLLRYGSLDNKRVEISKLFRR